MYKKIYKTLKMTKQTSNTKTYVQTIKSPLRLTACLHNFSVNLMNINEYHYVLSDCSDRYKER